MKNGIELYFSIFVYNKEFIDKYEYKLNLNIYLVINI